MRVLSPVVQAFVLSVLDRWHHLALGRAVARQLVRDHDPWCPALPLEELSEQALGGVLVAPALHQDVEHHPSLVHRAPEPVRDAGDLHHNLVQVPLIAGTGQPAADLVGEHLAELQRPLPHYCRTVSWLTMMPRAASSSSTMRRLRGKRK